MSIEIKPGRYYLFQFFINVTPECHPPNGGDLMGIVWREEDQPTTWNMDYRHRYYEDDKVWGSEDRKSWYECRGLEMPEAEVLEKIKTVVEMWGHLGGSEPDYFMIQGNSEKWFELMRANPPPWMHVKAVDLPPGTTEEEMREMAKKMDGTSEI